ncbi:MAG: Asp23/Gls24 family envelope stress response protein [Puniceicoccales bacterium]|jgi:uncharacterized alkaline shock family protein YloU|nr:Asp23/Gls24 family envelope stress response protein [Puniceicoccales bacterium]
MEKEQKDGEGRDGSCDLGGEVRINHSVIANIIRISTLEVDGVASVGVGFFDGVAEFFSRKNTERGVSVHEDEWGRYVIDVRVCLYFGSPLTDVAANIQKNVAQQVNFMTQKDVAQVNVTIDGVKTRGIATEKSLPEERLD